MVQIKRVSNTHLPCSIPSGVARNPLGCLLIQLDLLKCGISKDRATCIRNNTFWQIQKVCIFLF